MFDDILTCIYRIKCYFARGGGFPRKGKKYEVWGYDTYAGETYFCGSYDTMRKAQWEKKKLEWDAWLSQRCKSLRDSFGITVREDIS